MSARVRSFRSINESFMHLGQRRFLGRRRGMGEQPCVDRYINLMKNTYRSGRTAASLSMTHSSLSTREDSPGGRKHLGQRRERTLGRRGRVSGGRANSGISINDTENLEQRQHLGRRTTSCRGKRRAGRISIQTSLISLTIHLGTNTQPYIYQ